MSQQISRVFRNNWYLSNNKESGTFCLNRIQAVQRVDFFVRSLLFPLYDVVRKELNSISVISSCGCSYSAIGNVLNLSLVVSDLMVPTLAGSTYLFLTLFRPGFLLFKGPGKKKTP